MRHPKIPSARFGARHTMSLASLGAFQNIVESRRAVCQTSVPGARRRQSLSESNGLTALDGHFLSSAARNSRSSARPCRSLRKLSVRQLSRSQTFMTCGLGSLASSGSVPEFLRSCLSSDRGLSSAALSEVLLPVERPRLSNESRQRASPRVLRRSGCRNEPRRQSFRRLWPWRRRE